MDGRPEEQLLDGQLLSIGRRTALEKLAYLILHLHDRAEAVGYAGNLAFDVPFKQEHLSDSLGITPVHTSRTVRKLLERNLITWVRDRIQILDREGLEQVALYESDHETRRPLI